MEQPQSSKHGFLDSPLEKKDYVYGGKTRLKGAVINDDGDSEKHLFDGVPTAQAPIFESNACVSHSLENALQLLMRIVHGVLYEYSSRFLAKGSNTDPARGNTFKQVLDFMRHNWVAYINEWPNNVPTLAEYYSEIPEPVLTVAKARKKRVGYERITNPSPENIHEAARRGVVVMSTALMLKEDGTYYRPDGWTDGHAITYLKRTPEGLWRILDSYKPFVKTVHPYIPQAAYRVSLDEEEYTLLTRLVELLKQLLELLKKNLDKPSSLFPPPAYEVDPKELPMNKPDYIRLFAQAIKEFESGGNPNSLSMRLNNPGAIRGRDGKFLKFNTYAEGFAYLVE